MKKILLLNIICLLVCYSLTAKQSAKNVFNEYQIVNNSINTNVQSRENVTLDLGALGVYEIELFEQNYFSNNYTRINPSKHFTGSIKNYPNAKVSLTIHDNFMMGFIQINDEKIFIEPAYLFEDHEDSAELIAYKESDVIAVETSCAKQFLSTNQKRLSKNEDINNAMMSCSSYTLEIAMAADNLLYVDFKMQQDTLTTYLESIHNMSQPFFTNAFANNINLLLVETSIETSPTQFGLTNSLDAEIILNDLDRKRVNIWNNTYDIGALWTSRNISYEDEPNVAGLARLNSICNSNALTVNETYTSNIANLVKINSHEIGHVLGAEHDSDGTNFIMSSNASGTTWSVESVNAINNTLNSEVCQCVSGAFEDLFVNCSTFGSFESGNQKFITFTGGVGNKGNKASLESTYKVFLSSDEIVSTDDLEIISRDVQSLEAGQSVFFPISFFNLTAASAGLPNGIYNLLFQVAPNSDDANTENNATGNCFTFTVNNNGTSFYINNVTTVGSAIAPAKPIKVTWDDNIPNYERVSVYLTRNSQSYRKQIASVEAVGHVLIIIPYYYNAGDDYQFEIQYLQGNTLKAVGRSNEFSIVTDYDLYDVEMFSNNLSAGEQFTITYKDNIPDTEHIAAYLFRNDAYYVATISTDILATGNATLTLPVDISNGDNYNILLAYSINNGATVARTVSERFTISGFLRQGSNELIDELNITPNPVYNSTKINLSITEDKNVDITVYNIAGELVKTIVQNKMHSEGFYQFDFDMSSLAAGVYYINTVLDDKITSNKILKIQP